MSHKTPSWQHKALVAVFRLMRINKGTAADKRESVRRRDKKWTFPHPPKKVVETCQVNRTSVEGVPVWTLSPLSGEPHGAVVAVHGGGYTTELLAPHWSFYASLAREGGTEVVIPIYPLAPGGTAEAVVPTVADIITEQVDRWEQPNVALVGDSAGAGLAMAAVQEIVRRDATVPSRMVLISPWLDVTISDPRSASIVDPFGSAEGLRESGRMWSGDLDPNDSRVSPINGPIRGLPPTWVYAGSADVLIPDSLRLRERAAAEHERFSFDLREGLVHGWAGFTFLPEAREVAPAIMDQLTDPDVELPSAL